MKCVRTLSDSRKKRSDWLRQLRGGSFTTVRFRLCEIKTILKATTYPRIQAVHRTTHKAGLIFKPKPSLCSFKDELIRIRIFSTAIQTTDKCPICLFLSMVCQTVLQRLKSSYTIAESDLIFSLNSYFEHFSHDPAQISLWELLLKKSRVRLLWCLPTRDYLEEISFNLAQSFTLSQGRTAAHLRVKGKIHNHHTKLVSGIN